VDGDCGQDDVVEGEVERTKPEGVGHR
jgi:hypothetical protein